MLKRILIISFILSILIVLTHFARAESFESSTPAPVTNDSSFTASSTSTTTLTSVNDPSAETPAPNSDTFYSYYNYLFNNTDQPSWQKRTDFFYEFQQKNTPVVGLESVQPLYECFRCNLFAQGRAGYTSGSTAFNLGLGNRFITPDRNFMLGANLFYDIIFRYPHKRIGLGGEFFTPYITLRANFYDAYTGQRYAGDNTYERAASGFDGSIETPVPYIAWMRFTLKGYHWKGNKAKDVNGGLFNFRVYPARQVELAVGYANDSVNNSQLFLNFNYYFGAAEFIQYSASTPHPCNTAFVPQDLEKIKLEKVLRVNPIVTEKTHNGSTWATMDARTD